MTPAKYGQGRHVCIRNPVQVESISVAGKVPPSDQAI